MTRGESQANPPSRHPPAYLSLLIQRRSQLVTAERSGCFSTSSENIAHFHVIFIVLRLFSKLAFACNLVRTLKPTKGSFPRCLPILTNVVDLFSLTFRSLVSTQEKTQHVYYINALSHVSKGIMV